MIWSIRHTLTLWYIGILAIILCVFSGVLYTQTANSLTQDVDDVLASQAEGYADEIFSFWTAEQEAVPGGKKINFMTASKSIQNDIGSKKFTNLVIRWAGETNERKSEDVLCLINVNSQLIYQSKAFSKLNLLVAGAVLKEARRGRTVYQTFSSGTSRVRLIVRPIIKSSRILYFILTTASMDQVESSLSRLRFWLLSLIPLTLIVTSVVGWFLASMTLRPIDRMITLAQRIEVGKLNERISVPQTGDELERLGVTFNEMLSRLERAFKRLRQFTAAASHELRTPLTVMKGELELALRKPRDQESYRQVMATYLETVNELTQIVEELLTLARSETGEGAIEWRPVELNNLSKKTSGMFRSLAEKNSVNLKVNSSSSQVWVRGEQRLLERLLANLLDNAMKHTPSHGQITVDTKLIGDKACLIVRDTGRGISQEELPHIFDRFFSRKASSSVGERPGGLGLGLCRWIAEAHQGNIDVKSSLGKGTTFTVLLPAQSSLS